MLFHVLNWIDCDESQSPPFLFFAAILGI